jgi:hypothetical protein
MIGRFGLVGAMDGVAVAVAFLIAVAGLGRTVDRQLGSLDFAGLRLSVLWFLLMGAALGGVIVMSRSRPLVVAVPAALIVVAYTLFSTLGIHQRWLQVPDPVGRYLSDALRPATFVVLGVLIGTAVRRARERTTGTGVWMVGHVTVIRRLAAASVGAVIAVLLVAAMGSLSTDLLVPWNMRWAALGLVVLGAAFAGVSVIGERDPWIAVGAAAALILTLLLHPALALWSSYPWWPVMRLAVRSFDPSLASMAGVIIAGAAGHLVRPHRSGLRPSRRRLTIDV